MATDGALTRLIARHEVAIVSYFRRRCASAEEVEDLAQDVYCAMLEGYPRLRNVDSPSAWVMTICRNVFANHARRQARARSLVLPHDEGKGAVDELQRSLLMDSLSQRVELPRLC